MQALTESFLAAIDAEYNAAAYCMEIRYASSGGYVRYTDYDIPVIISGDVYQPLAFSVSSLGSDSASEIKRMSLSLDNVDRTFSSIFKANEERGSLVRVYFCALDEYAGVIDYFCLFGGEVEDYDYDTSAFNVSCVSPLAKLIKQSLNEISATCVNVFKGDVCQYAGEDTKCLHTYDDCAGKSNTDNFRGGIINTEVSTELPSGRVL